MCADVPDRALLDELLRQSQLYKTSQEYKDLLDFAVRLRPFAPFNAMLLQIQKPGLRFAASEVDWWYRFGRTVKPGSRPLMIMWPFGPVALVYDVVDTEGAELPADVGLFPAVGPVPAARLANFRLRLGRRDIVWYDADHGDGSAGAIRLVDQNFDGKGSNRYHLLVNKYQTTAQQFVTVVHELGHLFLGHLGPAKKLDVHRDRRPNHADRELEAESVAYLVCMRNGVRSRSEIYLSNFVRSGRTAESMDVYQVMKAAGQVETLLGLSSSQNRVRFR